MPVAPYLLHLSEDESGGAEIDRELREWLADAVDFLRSVQRDQFLVLEVGDDAAESLTGEAASFDFVHDSEVAACHVVGVANHGLEDRCFVCGQFHHFVSLGFG